MPHGPALCVRRLGTLHGHRSLSSDLTLPYDNTVYVVSVWLLHSKFSRSCATKGRSVVVIGSSGPLGSRPATASSLRGTGCRRGARGPRRTRGWSESQP